MPLILYGCFRELGIVLNVYLFFNNGPKALSMCEYLKNQTVTHGAYFLFSGFESCEPLLCVISFCCRINSSVRVF